MAYNDDIPAWMQSGDYNNDIPAWMQTDAYRSGIDPNSPDGGIAAFQAKYGYSPSTTPTTLKQARELGYFGPGLTSISDADGFISQLFQSKGLNEQQAVAATIQGQQAHQEKFGQGYTTGSSLSGIFNDLIFPAAGVARDTRLDTLKGWSYDDANARARAAADKEHGGDFGSATGLGQILSYQSNLGGNVLEAWKQDPERALLGINTPAESSIWGKVTGKDYRPTVDMTGGSTSYDTQSAQAKGIDTQSGEAMQQIAKMLAMKFGGNAVNGLFSSGGSTVSGSTGDSSVIGDASNDTLSGSSKMGDEWVFDDFSGEWVQSGGGGLDMTRLNDPSYWNPEGGTTGLAEPGATGIDGSSTTYGGNYLQQAQDLVKKYGPQLGGQLYKMISGKLGLPGGGAPGAAGSGGGGLFDGLLGTAARSAPGLMALAYANGQPGIDVGPLQGILAQLGGNQDAVIRAAQDPVQKNIAAGYGDLLQSQALRGIRGSSFGNTDIANYMDTTGRTLANAGATAAEGSLALQGNLAGNIATLKNQAQQIKNNLFGKAFDVLGRGLNPAPAFSLGGA